MQNAKGLVSSGWVWNVHSRVLMVFLRFLSELADVCFNLTRSTHRDLIPAERGSVWSKRRLWIALEDVFSKASSVGWFFVCLWELRVECRGQRCASALGWLIWRRPDLWQKLMSANHLWTSDKKRNDSDNIAYHSSAHRKEGKRRHAQILLDKSG